MGFRIVPCVNPAFRLRLHAGLYSGRLLRRLKTDFIVSLNETRVGRDVFALSALMAGGTPALPDVRIP